MNKTMYIFVDQFREGLLKLLNSSYSIGQCIGLESFEGHLVSSHGREPGQRVELDNLPPEGKVRAWLARNIAWAKHGHQYAEPSLYTFKDAHGDTVVTEYTTGGGLSFGWMRTGTQYYFTVSHPKGFTKKSTLYRSLYVQGFRMQPIVEITSVEGVPIDEVRRLSGVK